MGRVARCSQPRLHGDADLRHLIGPEHDDGIVVHSGVTASIRISGSAKLTRLRRIRLVCLLPPDGLYPNFFAFFSEPDIALCLQRPPESSAVAESLTQALRHLQRQVTPAIHQF